MQAYRILLVDDELALGEGYKDLLELSFEGCSVFFVHSIEEALEIDLNGYDAVITDYNLSKAKNAETGADLVKALRGKGYTEIIIGMSNEEDRRKEFLTAGANAFYYKMDAPFSLAELVDTLMK